MLTYADITKAVLRFELQSTKEMANTRTASQLCRCHRHCPVKWQRLVWAARPSLLHIRVRPSWFAGGMWMSKIQKKKMAMRTFEISPWPCSHLIIGFLSCTTMPMVLSTVVTLTTCQWHTDGTTSMHEILDHLLCTIFPEPPLIFVYDHNPPCDRYRSNKFLLHPISR